MDYDRKKPSKRRHPQVPKRGPKSSGRWIQDLKKKPSKENKNEKDTST